MPGTINQIKMENRVKYSVCLEEILGTALGCVWMPVLVSLFAVLIGDVNVSH